MDYAITFPEHGTFTPTGKAAIPDVDAHNAALTAAELTQWAERPDRWAGYVSDGPDFTTWTGAVLGRVVSRSTYRHNFGGTFTAIRVQATNGATYAGRFGSDWSQLCRVRRCK